MLKKNSTIPRQLARQAIEWQFAVQAGEASENDLNAWLAEDAKHQQAWSHIQAANEQLKALADPVARAALLTCAGKPRRKVIKVLSLLVFAGGAGIVAYRETPWRRTFADVSTSVGERSVMRLANGARLNLNSNTAVNINAQANQLRLTLINGEIMLTTRASLPPSAASIQPARAHERPLSVVTRDGNLQPLGTRFCVQQRQKSTQVTVFEGSVATFPGQNYVSKPAFSSQPPADRIIAAGQCANLSAGRLNNLRPGDESVSAWVDGMLVASSMPLKEFLATLSRHRAGYLGCDPSIASLAVSGTYPLENTDRILASLSQTLPVRVQRFSRYWARVIPADQG